jgi:hypothetical protein
MPIGYGRQHDRGNAVADEDFRVKLAFACATGVRADALYALRWRAK